MIPTRPPASTTFSPTPSYSSSVTYAHDADPAATAAAALSHQHVPTPNGNGRRRRPTGGPGSRGVANLSADQLAKKRANDREAQRAIRERTKTTIEALERRIRELESQQPFQDLQRALQERDRALAQCEELKQRLQQVVGIAGGSGNGCGGGGGGGVAGQGPVQNLHELAALTAKQPPLPLPRLAPVHATQRAYPPVSSSATANPPFEQQHLHPDLRSPPSASTTARGSPTISNVPSAGFGHPSPSETTLRKWSPSLEQTPDGRLTDPEGASHDQHRTQPQGLNNGDRLGLNFLLGSARSSPTTQTRMPTYNLHSSLQPAQTPIWARLPNNCPPNCPLDSLLSDFINNCRLRLASGVPMQDVIGPEYPCFDALLDLDPASSSRQSDASRRGHTPSSLLIDILSKFPAISALSEKVAVVYIMFLILRWEICPCEQCYERLPEWIRPTPEQLEFPHPGWTDNLLWPFMRNRFCHPNSAASRIAFDEWFIPYTSALSVNWPYPSNQVLILPVPPTGRANPSSQPHSTSSTTAKAPLDEPGQATMNPVFESHVRDMAHWSVGSEFCRTFPDVVDQSVRVVDRPLVRTTN